jgi:hypothetical protein
MRSSLSAPQVTAKRPEKTHKLLEKIDADDQLLLKKNHKLCDKQHWISVISRNINRSDE